MDAKRVSACIRFCNAAFDLNDRDATFDGASKHLGVSRSVFYSHFDNREQLICFAANHYREILVNKVLQLIADRPPIDGLTPAWVRYIYAGMLDTVLTVPAVHWLTANRLHISNDPHPTIIQMATVTRRIKTFVHLRHTHNRTGLSRLKSTAIIRTGMIYMTTLSVSKTSTGELRTTMNHIVKKLIDLL